jgi:predicted nucleic acid-binding protein
VRTAVDSSVLFDVLLGDPRFGRPSAEAIKAADAAGSLLASEIVWAEVRAHFPADQLFEQAMGLLGVHFDPLSREAAALAGRLWRDSRKGSGERSRVVADFLIGAHALEQADVLLTRDHGFYRRHFKGLRVISPILKPQ